MMILCTQKVLHEASLKFCFLVFEQSDCTMFVVANACYRTQVGMKLNFIYSGEDTALLLSRIPL